MSAAEDNPPIYQQVVADLGYDPLAWTFGGHLIYDVEEQLTCPTR